MARALYLTVDGVLDHIGFGQVLRVLEGLGNRGIRYSLVSLERARDLADAARVTAVRARLAERGIRWTHATYGVGGGAAVSRNLASLAALALAELRAGDVGVVHGRGYHGGLVAWMLRRSFGTPYVFDARGAWIDERIDDGRWFTTPRRVAAARAVERRLFRDAAAVITLTRLQADDVASLRVGPAVVIPTCADYVAFADAQSVESLPPEIVADMRGRNVLAIVGSLNRSYLADDTARLAASFAKRDANARVLVLTSQKAEWSKCLDHRDVPRSQVRVTSANHEEMPAWLSLVSWGALLLAPDSAAKRGSMPTKLAEFFAAGVQPVVHGCNAEMRDWVRTSGVGVVLDSLDDSSIQVAAERMIQPTSPASVRRAREITASHFSLASGIDRYERVIRPFLTR